MYEMVKNIKLILNLRMACALLLTTTNPQKRPGCGVNDSEIRSTKYPRRQRYKLSLAPVNRSSELLLLPHWFL